MPELCQCDKMSRHHSLSFMSASTVTQSAPTGTNPFLTAAFNTRAFRLHGHYTGVRRFCHLVRANMAKCWHLVCLWCAWHLQAAAFNLDTQNVLEKSGDPGSLFGFSVAFHQQLSPTTKNLWETALAIQVCVRCVKLCSSQVKVFLPQTARRSSAFKTAGPSECYRCCLSVWSVSNDPPLSAHRVRWRRFVCTFLLKLMSLYI